MKHEWWYTAYNSTNSQLSNETNYLSTTLFYASSNRMSITDTKFDFPFLVNCLKLWVDFFMHIMQCMKFTTFFFSLNLKGNFSTDLTNHACRGILTETILQLVLFYTIRRIIAKNKIWKYIHTNFVHTCILVHLIYKYKITKKVSILYISWF